MGGVATLGPNDRIKRVGGRKERITGVAGSSLLILGPVPDENIP